VRAAKRSGDGALDILDLTKAVSRYDHPSAAAAPGTPVLATALQIFGRAALPVFGDNAERSIRLLNM